MGTPRTPVQKYVDYQISILDFISTTLDQSNNCNQDQNDDVIPDQHRILKTLSGSSKLDQVLDYIIETSRNCNQRNGKKRTLPKVSSYCGNATRESPWWET